jgi:hypothetical protein
MLKLRQIEQDKGDHKRKSTFKLDPSKSPQEIDSGDRRNNRSNAPAKKADK